MANFITKEGLVALDNYKYVGGEYSWLDNKMNPFWYKIADLLPMRMAPNTVTLIGFTFMVSSYAAILFYDMTLKATIPSWLFFKAAFEIFMYQTLDAVDGKQARRTKSSSPLGQLFDHGCDSFSITFFVLVLSQAMLLDTDVVYLSVLGTQSNWIEYHTHILNTQYGNFGVTEVEFISVAITLMAGIFGQNFFQIIVKDMIPSFLANMIGSIPIAEKILYTNAGEICAYGVLVCIFIVFVVTFTTTFIKIENKNKLYALVQYVPFLGVIGLQWYWYNSSIFNNYAGFILFSFGIMFSTICSKMIICSLTRMKFGIDHTQLNLFIIFTVIYHFTEQYFDEQTRFYLFFIASVLNVIYALRFVSGVIEQITKHLGIYCFSLDKRPKRN